MTVARTISFVRFTQSFLPVHQTTLSILNVRHDERQELLQRLTHEPHGRILNLPGDSSMIRILGTILAALLGLAFGSFLNVCLSRWPAGQSVVKPRSHCRNCGRTLAWWENIPLLSWLVLRGRCQTCKEKISWRYPLVEAAIGILWSISAWRFASFASIPDFPQISLLSAFISAVGLIFFLWLLVFLAVLDAENLWLPNWLTLPGTAIGLAFAVLNPVFDLQFDSLTLLPLTYNADYFRNGLWRALLFRFVAVLLAAALILLIRWTYWLIRHREGIGLGDAKLMAMLGAWLGLSGALLSFAIGVLLGAVFALVVLAVPAARRESDTWLLSKMPLGTFLCVGGIISALWGQPLIAAYLRLVGLR
jgi:leader peptidase (prepilin peptidase)/N-methyltransferase